MNYRDRPGVGPVDGYGLPPVTNSTTANELRARRAHLLQHCATILDQHDEHDGGGPVTPLTPKEKQMYDTRIAEVEALDERIVRQERLEAAEAQAILARVAPTNSGATKMTDTTVTESLYAGGKLQSFSNDRAGREAAYRVGMWAKATLLGDPVAQRYVVEHGIQAALSGGANSAGGALVPEEFERAIIDLRERYGVCRRLMRVVPMGSDTLLIPRRTGGVTAYFVGENTEGTESDASWDTVTLSAKKLMVLTRMSSELAEDAIIDLGDWLAQEIGYAFAMKEDQCGLLGTGTSTYGGIMGAFVKAIDGSHALATIAAASGHDTFGELDLDDLVSLVGLIPEYALPGSVWLCSAPAKAAVFDSLRAAVGGVTAADVTQGFMGEFLGFPIVTSPLLPSGTSTDYTGLAMLGFGNLRLAATMGSRRGIRVGLTDQRYWSSDQIGVKGTERFDIVVHDLGSSTVASPFAVLTGGAG